MRYNSSSLCGHGLSVSMNPSVWVLKWCNPNHIALKMTVLAASTDRMLMIAIDYNPSDWTPSNSLDIFVNTFECADSSRRKMSEKVLIWYHHYRQKAFGMSILKQSASNRRQKYNNRRQSVHSKREFQWSLYGFSSPPPSLTLLCAFAARQEMHTKLFLLLSKEGCVCVDHLHTHTHHAHVTGKYYPSFAVCWRQ